MLARVQTIEIGDAVDTEQHRLAVQDEVRRTMPESHLNKRRIAVAPFGAFAGE